MPESMHHQSISNSMYLKVLIDNTTHAVEVGFVLPAIDNWGPDAVRATRRSPANVAGEV